MPRGCRVYIGNLSSRVREREIEDDFGRYGRIRDISLKSGFGFVEYERPDDAEYAIRKMQGVNLDGQRISCEFAKELGDRRGPRGGGGGGYDRGGGGRGGGGGGGNRGSTGFRLTVENLSHETSWQDLKDFARTGGKVLYTDVRSERGEPVGVIEYETKDDMLDALDKLDGRELQGSRIRLSKEAPGSGGGGGGRGKDEDRRPRERSRSRDRDTKRRSRSRSRDRSPPPRKEARSVSPSDRGGRDESRNGKDDGGNRGREASPRDERGRGASEERGRGDDGSRGSRSP